MTPEEPKGLKEDSYLISIFSAAEMNKVKSKREPMNESVNLLVEVPWDPLKAQILAKIVKTLNPKFIAFEDYTVTYYISRTLPKPGLSLTGQMNFDGLMKRVKGMPLKTLIVNIIVIQVTQVPATVQGQRSDSQSDDEATAPRARSNGLKRV